MADTATTPPASPTDTIIPAATSGRDNVGKKSPQPADKPKTAPTAQKDNPAPKLRQDYPSRKAGKREQQFRSQPDGNSRRKQFQPGTGIRGLTDLGGGSARFDKLGPWHRSQLLSFSATRWEQCAPLDAPLRPIPMGGDELKLVRQDLEAEGHRGSKGVDSSTVTMKIGLADVYAELTKQAWKQWEKEFHPMATAKEWDDTSPPCRAGVFFPGIPTYLACIVCTWASEV